MFYRGGTIYLMSFSLGWMGIEGEKESLWEGRERGRRMKNDKQYEKKRKIHFFCVVVTLKKKSIVQKENMTFAPPFFNEFGQNS